MSSQIQQLQESLAASLAGVVIGAEAVTPALVIALVSRGHVLVQGVPGLGKTLLAKTLARTLGGDFKRIQGTADLMPSDIIGVYVFDEASRDFVFRPGPLFADVVLVDEINRAGPKTQSALLEAMEERQVSLERAALPLPPDFLVLATQNPREFEGTYPLPESQLDRFMLRIDIGYPPRAAEAQVLVRYGGVLAEAAAAVAQVAPLPAELLGAARADVERVHVAEALGELTHPRRTFHEGARRTRFSPEPGFRNTARRNESYRRAWGLSPAGPQSARGCRSTLSREARNARRNES